MIWAVIVTYVDLPGASNQLHTKIVCRIVLYTA